MATGIPKGTRDFAPKVLAKRNYIFDTIKEVYRRYGFQPLETPAMENLSTLTGKYGDEGDKLLFRILNSGDFLSGVTDTELAQKEAVKLSSKICEKGLRYDLTVPFARYVADNRGEIAFPFKRYQIQPVWRADRPQKGRYREFYQCDADVVGSDSLLNELEIVQMIDDVFSALDLRVAVKINNRKLLAGIAERIGFPDKIVDITVAIDKLDKIGAENVYKELAERGLTAQAIKDLEPILNIKGNFAEKMELLRNFVGETEIGKRGIAEVETLFGYLDMFSFKAEIELDLTLARGLNYYTGAIFEVKSLEAQMGSICGGGRYDDLTGVFGLKDMSGVGISFGADRIFDVLEQLGKFPEKTLKGIDVLITNFGEKEVAYALPVLKKMRDSGISAVLYPDSSKLKKQMKYADDNSITYVVLVGDKEIENKTFTLKNMKSGEQFELSEQALLTMFVS